MMSHLFFFFCFSSLPSGFEENLEVQGELILQDSFQVWDPRSLIRKGRDRHLFLFEFSLVFSKEIKDSAGRTKYQYKNRLLVSVLCHFFVMFMVKCSRCAASGQWPTDLWCFICSFSLCLHLKQLCFPHMSLLHLSYFLDILQTSELGVTEHIEGDPCKFALWAGRTPSSDNKTVLKVLFNWNKGCCLCCVYVLSVWWLFYLCSIRRPAWKPNRSGLRTSGRWSRRGWLTWRGRWRSLFISRKHQRWPNRGITPRGNW